jgi:hypothetical protein
MFRRNPRAVVHDLDGRYPGSVPDEHADVSTLGTVLDRVVE